jgi:hypothetical protein
MGLGHLRWQAGKPHFHGSWADLKLIGGGLLAAFLVLLPYALKDSAYGPVLTLDQARAMFALSDRGWSKFFVDDFADFWLFGKRSGLFPGEWATVDLKVQPQLWLTLAIPVLLALPGASPGARAVAPRVVILLQVAIASVVCFVLAHAVLFELHLPNRYTEHSFRILVALGAGVAIALIGDRGRARSPAKRPVGLWSLLGLWAIAPITISYLVGETFGNYTVGQFPHLYQYLQNQPQATVIASLDPEINNIPSFTNRPIFVGGEGFTLPYHLGFYEPVKQRSVDLINAQYSTDRDTLDAFLARYPIDLWLITPAMFTPEWVQSSRWLLQYAEYTEVQLQSGPSGLTFVLPTLIEACQVTDRDTWIVLDADCLRTSPR